MLDIIEPKSLQINCKNYLLWAMKQKNEAINDIKQKIQNKQLFLNYSKRLMFSPLLEIILGVINVSVLHVSTALLDIIIPILEKVGDTIWLHNLEYLSR